MPLTAGIAPVQKDTMSHRGYGRHLSIECICKVRAMREKAIEAAMVIASKAGQVVVAKLIDNDTHYQLRFGSRGG